ncbi:T9SS type A sorting domain-containing protein [Flavobacterium sp. RHBU_24]|uniref:RCC1 domain-containing protein n=1 Tax=Flavobacterium sp. RHBU_24 TaxID=3391185 RepID=UPI003984F8BC
MIKNISFLLAALFMSAAVASQCQKSFSLGWTHSVSIKEDGTLWSWGSNGNGQLGIGSTTNSNIPVQVGSSLWKAISASEDHTIAIKQDGTLWSWGSNFQGVLGNGTMYNGSNVPVQIGTANDWSQISSGPFHVLAIKEDGTLWAWGSNAFSALGNGTGQNSLTPIQIGVENDWKQVSAGYGYSIALKNNGTRWAWGANYEGMLGNGTLTGVSIPTQIGTDTDWASFSTGHYHTAAFKTDGSLWMWGRNNDGQVGNGTSVDVTTPIQISPGSAWKYVIAYASHTMAIKADGTLWTWGDNADYISSLIPVQTGTSTAWREVYSGGNHYVGIENGGNYLTWGANYYGQLGNGNNTQNNTPQVMGCVVPHNDLCADAVWLIPGTTCTYTGGTFSNATISNTAASCAGLVVQDVWYKFVATDVNMDIELSADAGDPAFEIFQGSCAGTAVLCDNSSTGTSEAYEGTNFVAGQVYYIRVLNAAGQLSSAAFNLCLIGPSLPVCTPSVAISSPSASVCSGQSVVFTAEPVNGGTTPSYQWKLNGNDVGTDSTTYTASTFANGDLISVIMTSNAPCATTTTVTSNTVTMSVSDNDTPTFTQIAPICEGSLFTLPLTSDNGITGTWSPAVNNTMTTTYTFTPNAGQCAVPTTMTVTVSNNITPTFTQIAPICEGSLFTLPLTSDNGITGTWSPAINNTMTTTYTFTPNAGQCAVATIMTVTVSNNITPTFTQVAPICAGGLFTLPVTSDNGITGTWSPEVNNTMTTTYTFTPNAGQCAATATMAVEVNSVDAGVTVQENTMTASATEATYQWINCVNNQSVNGATGASFTPTENGSYAVIVSQNGCSQTSDCFTIAIAGVDTIVTNGWKMYPNPVVNYLYIEVDNAAEIMIADITGKSIMNALLVPGNNNIDVSNISPGIYIITSAGGLVAKLIKQ